MSDLEEGPGRAAGSLKWSAAGETLTLDRQSQTPLFTGLLEHAGRQPVQFHIPGHKRGAAVPEDFRTFLGRNAFSIDLINIAPLDDLHNPHGIIKEAEELAAEAFGADATFFSVQGTTGAIMTMVMATVGPGDKILVPRNVHKSVMTAIVMSGARPIYMQPEFDRQLGVAHGVSLGTVERHLEAHPDAKAVLVINPTYFGVAADLAGIVQLAHARDIPVLVDEAHGAHIHFHPELPLSAMEAGADLAATSIHKLGGSLTQTSILNVKGPRVNTRRVQSVLSMLTTTSTSYILMASLDVARRELALHGEARIGHAITEAREARRRINEIPGLYCFGDEVIGDRSSSFDYDPTKLCVCVKGLGITGIEVEQRLRREFNIEIELSDLYNILCVITAGDTHDEIDYLVRALGVLSNRYYGKQRAQEIRVTLPEITELALLPRDAFYAPSEPVPLAQSVGRIAAEFVMVYPPGIPIVQPGELITAKTLSYIKERLAAGLPIQGPEDPSLATLKVVRAEG